jgi:putative membrane protein
MIIRWLLAALHLIALPIGFTAIWGRRQALRATLDVVGLRRVFRADTWWGLAALVWIATGLLRAFGGYEKPSAYYLQNDLFLLKMTLLAAILLLEIAPMVTLIRWRIAVARGGVPNTGHRGVFALISTVQAVLILLMVAAATGMARGFHLALP